MRLMIRGLTEGKLNKRVSSDKGNENKVASAPGKGMEAGIPAEAERNPVKKATPGAMR